MTRALRFGPAGELTWGSVVLPPPGPHEVQVAVRASGLNRADLLQRRGLYPAPPGPTADIPGLEYAGEVVACGPGVTRHALGARVMGIVASGGLAEAVVVHEGEALAVPAHLSWAEAAALPEAVLTAHDALRTQAGMLAGERVLIHAVASGVGTAAAQLVALLGAQAVGTTRSADKLERLRAIAPQLRVVVPEDGRFADAVGPVDVVLDLVGAAYFDETLRCTAPKARWIVVGALGGLSAELPLGTLLTKRLTLRGTVLRSRGLAEKRAVVEALERDAGAALHDGRLRPVLDRAWPVDALEAAWGAMASNSTVGKVVVTW